MSNADPFVTVENSTYALTLAPDNVSDAVHGKNGDGQGALVDGLQRTPLAALVLSDGRPRRMDHIHLSRFDGTDFCQWYGRAADGFHYPIGAIMQIVRVVR